MAALRKNAPSLASVRVSVATHEKLQALAKQEERPMSEIVMDLVDRYEDEAFWSSYEKALDRLRDDPQAWADYQAEIRELDAMGYDGLQDEDPYFTPEEEEEISAKLAHAEGR